MMNNSFFIVLLFIQISLLGCASTFATDLNQQRIEESPQWNGKKFQNPERVPATEWVKSLVIFPHFKRHQPKERSPVFHNSLDSHSQ